MKIFETDTFIGVGKQSACTASDLLSYGFLHSICNGEKSHPRIEKKERIPPDYQLHIEDDEAWVLPARQLRRMLKRIDASIFLGAGGPTSGLGPDDCDFGGPDGCPDF